MTWMRVLKKFEWPTQRGVMKERTPGQLVDVLNKHDVDRLLQSGMITYQEHTFGKGAPEGEPAHPFKVTKRIGIWLKTSANYSGGRVHMYQYGRTLAELGAEVYLITNRPPMWARDYPPSERLHILIEGTDSIPKDLDLVVTDSKQELGLKALAWKQKHPRIPFVCFNFETPNWVHEYEPKYAARLQGRKDVFKHANLLISNSDISSKYAQAWLGKKVMAGVVNPCVNDFGLEASVKIGAGMPVHPFAVYTARPTAYKGGDLVVKTIWALDEPFDLVAFGELVKKPKDTEKHRFHQLKSESDAKKFALMRKAKMVLAPSKFEGFGMVPGEALASGTPCIVYDLPVLREAYGDDLEYVKWNDAKAFREKVKSFVKNGKKKVSATVQKKTVKDHGMKSMVSQVEALPYHAIKKKSVSAHMIGLWGVVPEAIESVYPHVDQILIAFGPTKLNRDFPSDGSLERIKNFPDPDNKIQLEVRDVWEDKLEMRSWCSRRITGNHQLILDGDEIWHGLENWIKADYPYSCPRWINLWHGPDHWVYDNAKMAGLRWGKKMDPYGSVCPHYRWSWWRASYNWRRHPCVQDMNGKLLHSPNNAMVMERVPTCVIYHLGHALPDRIMKAKHEFYRRRDGDNKGRRKRQETWEKWNAGGGKRGDGTGDSGDGIIERVDWDVPEIVTRALKGLEGVK